MTIYEGVFLLVAVIALFMSGYALWISVPLQRQQRRKIEETRAERKKADVRVTLEDSGRPARFVIENLGPGTARDVHLVVEPREGSLSPLVQGDYDEKLPIEVLRAGGRVELIAALTQGTGYVFTAKWRWRDEDGELQDRHEKVAPLRG